MSNNKNTVSQVRGFCEERSNTLEITSYNKRLYRLDKTRFPYKNITIWTEHKLIEDHRELNAGWRAFSLTEIVWLELMKSLKAYGLNRKVLCVVKAGLQKPSDNSSYMPMIDFHLFRILNDNSNVFVNTDQKGQVNFQIINPNQNHITSLEGININLTKLVLALQKRRPECFSSLNN